MGQDPFRKHFNNIGREIQRKDIAFIKQQYGREDKLGQPNYDFNREPIYIKKANVGLGLWDACHEAPAIPDQTVSYIKDFGLSLDGSYLSELDNIFTDNTCQKKLLKYIMSTSAGFSRINANLLDYVISNGFTDPPAPQPIPPVVNPPAPQPQPNPQPQRGPQPGPQPQPNPQPQPQPQPEPQPHPQPEPQPHPQPEPHPYNPGPYNPHF